MATKPNWKERALATAAYAKARGHAIGAKKPFEDHARKSHLKRKYAITLDDFKVLLQEQKGACAICKTVFAVNLGVDHDHKTGLVRGLLCHRCNVGLGYFKDNKDTLLEAANYIAGHEALVLRVFNNIKNTS